MPFIVIQHYQFPIKDCFAEGHVMTAVEANVLNWHRARLIQKIVTRWVNEAQEASSTPILSPDELSDLTQRIKDFDAAYNLQNAKEPRASILEYNLDLLAQNFLYRNGYTNLQKEDIDRIKQTPEIQARAREIISSGTFSLEELIA